MVVVDEADDAVVEALVVRHVGVGRVDADGLAEELGERAVPRDEVVEDVAGARWSRSRIFSSSRA